MVNVTLALSSHMTKVALCDLSFGASNSARWFVLWLQTGHLLRQTRQLQTQLIM